MRKEHYLFCQDVTHLRESTSAFDGDAAINRVYTHNDNSVMAYTRSKGGDTYLVVSNFNQNGYSNYGMATPDGQWQLVLDSDDAKYGGTGAGKSAVTGGQGSQFDLPAGGLLVYKKVG
jgi:1,4-alpha-glucan branching enzyme